MLYIDRLACVRSVSSVPYARFLPEEEGGAGESFKALYSLPRRAVLLSEVHNITTTDEVLDAIPRDMAIVYEKRSPSQIATRDDVEYGRARFAEFYGLLLSDADDVYMTVQTEELFSTSNNAVAHPARPRMCSRTLVDCVAIPLLLKGWGGAIRHCSKK